MLFLITLRVKNYLLIFQLNYFWDMISVCADNP